jgi:hypothetical protein
MNGYRHIPSGPFGRPSTSRACKCKEETQESFELARSEVARPLPPNVRRVASLCHLKALEEQNLHRRQPKKKNQKEKGIALRPSPFCRLGPPFTGRRHRRYHTGARMLRSDHHSHRFPLQVGTARQAGRPDLFFQAVRP